MSKNAKDIIGNNSYPAISYGGYRGESREIQPSVEDIKEDLRIIFAQGFRIIRTYDLHHPFAENTLKAISELKRMRLKLDKRVWSYADSIQDFGKLVREFKASPPRGNTSKRKKLNEIQTAAEKIEKEVIRIRNNKELMEELIQD